MPNHNNILIEYNYSPNFEHMIQKFSWFILIEFNFYHLDWNQVSIVMKFVNLNQINDLKHNHNNIATVIIIKDR